MSRKPASVLTALGFVAWIERNVPQRKRPGQTPLQAACWYWAWQEAETYAEETTRHVAQMLLHGHPGYSTLAHVAEALDGLDTEDEVLAAMREFWQVRGGK